MTVVVSANGGETGVSGATATNAGSYTAEATQLTGTAAGNYKLPNAKTKSFSIGKATVDFEIDGDTTFTYDTKTHTVKVKEKDGDATKLPGDGNPYSVVYTANESVNSNDGAANKTDVGTYKVWVKLSADAFMNYQFEGGAQEKSVGTMTIKQAALTLNVSGSAITYGQTLSQSDLTGKATIDGGTEIAGSWAWGAEAASTYPSVKDDSGKTQYKVTFSPTSSDASNFTSESLSTTITITVKPFTLTPQVDSVDSKTYDGNVTAQNGTLKFAENLDIVPFKDNKPTATGTFNFTDKNVGENKHVNVTDITLNNSTDYALSEDSISGAETTAKITAKEVSLTWQGYTGLVYSGTAKNVTATTTDFVDDDNVSLTYEQNAETNAGTYTAKAGLDGDDAGNYSITNPQQAYTIAPATVSFTIGEEAKVGWSTRGETNADPNPEGYDLDGSGTNYALTMTYDSYGHKANVSQTDGEAVKIVSGAVNGFTVTYKRIKDSSGGSVTEDAKDSVRDAGTYEIWVTINPVEGDIYNYAFDGQGAGVHSLKIGQITVKPYEELLVTWTHLKYVYHAHSMHPELTVQNAFKADAGSVPDGFNTSNPDAYTGKVVVPFAATSGNPVGKEEGANNGSDVGEYQVTAKLYGSNAGNYRIKNNTATVTIVPAPVTFTVADNIWVIDEDGTPDRSSVTLKPTWGAVTVEPDLAVHHTYPTPGTRIESDLNLTIQYRKDNVTYDEAPTEAGTYEILVTIGNTNFRHSALSDGASHNVGELIVTDNPDSIEKYTVHFDLGYEGAPSDGPADMADLFANQTVVLPPYSGTRQNFLFQGWRYDGRVYLANEEFHMPASDVTFTAEWLDETSVRTVGGTVKREQEDDPSQSDPLYGATVTLKQGSNEIGETSTDANGKFTFENLVPGIYNLEIRYSDGSAEVVETYLVNVEGEDSLNGEYILPSGALNTVVESDVTAVVDLENIVAEASDDGIYTTDDEKTVKDGGTVEFKMTIHSAELTTGQTEEIPVPEDRIGMVLALELTKTVTKNSGDPKETDIHDAKVPVTTIIHLPAELQGKSSYTVYRFHDMKDEEGSTTLEMQTITTSPNSDGEYLRVIREGTAIELYAEFYSTYVLTWTQNTGVYYSVKLPERVENGSITANYQSALRNSTVTLTAKPDEGYVLGELTVTDKDGKEVALTDHGDGTYSFKMPDGGVTVKVVFKCVGGERCPSRKFADLNVNAWYHEYTDYVITKDLMHGVSGNLFVPEGTVTRAQMVTVLWNMSGKPVVNYYMTYSDVSEEAWYAEAIRWASSEGIAGGYGNNRFGPDDPITREQMAAMLYRYEQRYGNGGFTGDWMYRLPFTDLDKMSDWAFEAVAWCNMNGVIKGRDGNVFDPHGYARRNEMAAVLTRYGKESGEQ